MSIERTNRLEATAMIIGCMLITACDCGDGGGGAPDDGGPDPGDVDLVEPTDGDWEEAPWGDEGDAPGEGDAPEEEWGGDACVPAGPELCDGLDNDCNGEVDEGFDLGAACTSGKGICEAAGVLVCAGDGLSSVCDAEPGEGTDETCNEEDDDCDGLTDEYGVCAETSCLGATPGAQKCSYSFANAGSTPAISPAGTVYLTASDTTNPKLHSLGLDDCTPNWVFTFDDEGYFTSPAVGEEGTVHVGFKSMFSDIPSRIVALDASGTEIWSLPFTEDSISPTELALGTDGTIYFGDGHSGGKFYAVNGDGTLKWALEVGGSEFRGAPAIGPDGTVYAATWQYFGGPPAAVYAIADDGDHGTVLWEFAPAGGAFTMSHSPATGADGTVYVGLFLPGEGNIVLYAVDPATGSEAWHYTMDATTTTNSALAVGADGAVYAKSTDGRLHALLPDGTPKWTPFDTGSGGWYEAPALGADGTLYIGADGRLLCLDAGDGSLVWESTIDGVPGSPTIARNGTLFFSTTSPAFLALCSTSAGLADAPWPKDLHEERNSANSVMR